MNITKCRFSFHFVSQSTFTIQEYSLAGLILCVTFPVELHQVARLSWLTYRYFIHKCWQSPTFYRKEMFPFRFAKYRFFILFRSISFRKVQIFHFVSSHFVSQSTDFSFRFVPFRFAEYRFFISFCSISFRSILFRSISFRSISFRPISFRKVQ